MPRIRVVILRAAAIAWLLCLVPTGMELRNLVVFAGPGAVLWLRMGCAANVVVRRDVSWRSAR